MNKLLLDGLIRINPDVINEVCAGALSALYTILLNEYNDDDDKIKKLHRFMKIISVKISNLIHPSDVDVETRLLNLDLSGYSKKFNSKKRNRVIKIKSGKLNGVYTGTNQTMSKYDLIQIDIPQFTSYKDMLDDPKNISDFLIELKGVVEHELIHSVQVNVLNQEERYDSLSSVEDIIMDDIEFGPLIISTKSHLEYIFKRLGVFDQKEKNKITQQFTTPTYEDTYKIGKSKFYTTLFNNNKNKWKKAVKYLYMIVSER